MKNQMKKIWLEGRSDLTNKAHYGMSSALGATKEDLPLDEVQGSDCFDYTTQTVYFFDGVGWN